MLKPIWSNRYLKDKKIKKCPHTKQFQCIIKLLYASFPFWKVKVKVTLVQALRLCTGRTARSGSRGIALPFLDHGTRRGVGSASRSGRSLPPGKNRYPLYRRLGGPVWTGAENLAPTGIRSPDRPARSQSLYRLHYPAHILKKYTNEIHNYKFNIQTGINNFG